MMFMLAVIGTIGFAYSLGATYSAKNQQVALTWGVVATVAFAVAVTGWVGLA